MEEEASMCHLCCAKRTKLVGSWYDQHHHLRALDTTVMVVPTRPHPPHHHTQALPREILAATALLAAPEVLRQVILLLSKFHPRPTVPPQRATQLCNAITLKAIIMPIIKMARSTEIQKALMVSKIKVLRLCAYIDEFVRGDQIHIRLSWKWYSNLVRK